MLDAYHYSTRRCQLVGMNLGTHAPCGGCLQNASGLFGSEEATVAEHVNEVGKTLASHFRYHLVNDKLDVLFLRHAACHCVRTEERRHYLSRRSLLHALYHAEHLQLVFEAQSVAALYLDASGSLTYHFVKALHGLTEELVLGSAVQEVGRIEDASSTAGYLLIAESVYLIHKLPLTASGEDDVRVRVAP